MNDIFDIDQFISNKFIIDNMLSVDTLYYLYYEL
jgi:hypothetical protein